jgi:AcrR family transcriptional regulator
MTDYHHGALHDALLDAARAMLEREGLDALSLRAVARLAGVSTAAPYHHFSDKQALLTALALSGFERLQRQLERARLRFRAPKERLQAVARAYLTFAKAEPALYQLMFSPMLARSRAAPLGHASFAALDELRLAVRGARPRADSTDVLLAWAAGHGIALLAQAQLLTDGGAQSPRVEDALVRRLVAVLEGR